MLPSLSVSKVSNHKQLVNNNKRNNSSTHFADKKVTMPFTTLYITGSNHQEQHTFANQAEAMAWDAQVHALKDESTAVLNRRLAVGSLTSEILRLYHQWIDNVKQFRDTYGEDPVPADIKWALNSAEEGLGLEVTQWTNPPDTTLFE